METLIAVVITTSLGDIHLELDSQNAPITVQNFVELAEKNYYDNTIFHRVINNFMVQGGGLTADMKTKPSFTAPIQNCLLYTSPSPRDTVTSRMPSSA